MLLLQWWLRPNWWLMLDDSLGSNWLHWLSDRKWYLLMAWRGFLLRHIIFISESIDRGRVMLERCNRRLSCLGLLGLERLRKTLVERDLIQGEVIDIVLALWQGRLLCLRRLSLWRQ